MPDRRDDLTIRNGDGGDADLVLAMFDRAVAWLVSRGQTGQWGEVPFSRRPERVAAAHRWAESGGLRIAEVAGVPAGAMVVGPPVPYAPPAAEPELYVQALVTDRRRAGLGVGRALLDRARREAEDLGVRLLRVDCWAGAQERLVGYYESAGFVREAPFAVDNWHGMVLAQRW
ncbi:GNAT family N-acetyltransferase [Rhizohabitans arisaemae]|uniref:GNAT family N-acetyltransferase n=1 Tax=Rhizohabitans arisaemae TaxID=2720610 RepID=UPI0024B04F4C|nr:GNAT family N-acetyltransferase [Rhizohabitans arisaemae]